MYFKILTGGWHQRSQIFLCSQHTMGNKDTKIHTRYRGLSGRIWSNSFLKVAGVKLKSTKKNSPDIMKNVSKKFVMRGSPFVAYRTKEIKTILLPMY